MTRKSLAAEKRSFLGRKVKKLRQEGLVPGNVFGNKVKSLAVQVKEADFRPIYKEVGETGLVDLKVGDDVRPVLVHNLQLHPKTDEIVHVDFLQVDLKEKVEAEVPVELVGESPAEKQSLGTVVQQLNEIEVEALPTDLPEKFEVDITTLSEVDQAIYVKDLKYDKSKIEIKGDLEAIVVKVEPPQKEEVVEVAPVEGEEAGTEGAAEKTSEEQAEPDGASVSEPKEEQTS